MKNGERYDKVNKSMRRIKYILHERSVQYKSKVKEGFAKSFVNRRKERKDNRMKERQSQYKMRANIRTMRHLRLHKTRMNRLHFSKHRKWIQSSFLKPRKYAEADPQ